jgi:hypothetical protein
MIKIKSNICIYDDKNILHVLDYKYVSKMKINSALCVCGIFIKYKNIVAAQNTCSITCQKCFYWINNYDKFTSKIEIQSKYIRNIKNKRLFKSSNLEPISLDIKTV